MKKYLMYLMPILALLMITSCAKPQGEESIDPSSLDSRHKKMKKKKEEKIKVCHFNYKYGWEVKDIKVKDWAKHQEHGDVRLDDEDGDGYVPTNECVEGNMGDCDDTDMDVYPGATEVCDNGIDDDCDGLTDDDDDDCVSLPVTCWDIEEVKAIPVYYDYIDTDVIPDCGAFLEQVAIKVTCPEIDIYVRNTGDGYVISYHAADCNTYEDIYSCTKNVSEADYIIARDGLREAIALHPDTPNRCE